MQKKPGYFTDTKLHSLVKLGLTVDEAKCYGALLKSGTLDAKGIAKRITILPNAVYRLIKRLEQNGFVVILNTHPARFQAIPPSIAVETLSKKKINEIETLTAQSVQELTSSITRHSTKIEFFTGRSAMFDASLTLIQKAKKEILIESIGEPVPDEIKIANVKAIERGITIRFIVHTYNEENKGLLQSWIKMGLDVRYYPESGYHLQIADSQTCLLSTSNPENTSERSSVIMHSEGLSRAMKTFFLSTWDKAKPV